MKLFTAIASAAVIGGSLIATATPANAYSQNCRSDGFGGFKCTGDGGTTTIRSNGFGGYRTNCY